jgi:rubrerythrin
MLKGSKTEQNLLKAFAGESQARNRYTMYASKAKKEGYEQIAAIFLETAENEREHASLFYKKLEGGNVEITASYPAGDIGSTLENLNFAATGEYEEWSELYPKFARIAKEEGFNDVSGLFERIATIEKRHEERYRELYENVEKCNVFKKGEEVEWVCRECGYVHKGTTAPETCPVCSHAQAFYQVLNERY